MSGVVVRFIGRTRRPQRGCPECRALRQAKAGAQVAALILLYLLVCLI